VGDSICICLTGVLWTKSVHFPDSYPIDVSHFSDNFLCCCFRYESLWPHLDAMRGCEGKQLQIINKHISDGATTSGSNLRRSFGVQYILDSENLFL
jgi:hypothetical protein